MRFEKGQIPWNKDLKTGPSTSSTTFRTGNKIGERTRFRKGHVSPNRKDDGTYSIRNTSGRKYAFVKIGKEWVYLHRLVWIKSMGEIPEGANVQFKDKNTLNCDPENLYVITRDKQMLENTSNRYSPELRDLMKVLAKLKRKIHEKQN